MKITVIAILLVLLAACANHGSMPIASIGGDQETIAFRMLQSDAPADAWTILARLEREDFASMRQSVFVRSSPDTIRIAISGIAAGYWKVTVSTKDSTGNIRLNLY